MQDICMSLAIEFKLDDPSQLIRRRVKQALLNLPALVVSLCVVSVVNPFVLLHALV
jgi:hypothetical protein